MIKLVVDSTSEIEFSEAKELGVELIPMKVRFDDEEYLVGVNLSVEEFYQKLAESKNLPKTTQINCEEYVEKIKTILDGGDQVLVMSLSSELSGSFNSLKMASEELNSPNLEIFDTLSVTFAYRALVFEALKMIQGGISLNELKNQLENLRDKLKIYAIIDNVKYLIKGGRLSLTQGIAATALNIKPIVTIKEGKVEVVNKAVGFSLALKTLCKLIINVDETKELYYGHSSDREKAEKMHAIVKKQTGIEFKDVCNIGAVIGTHAGPGCVGVVFFEK